MVKEIFTVWHYPASNSKTILKYVASYDTGRFFEKCSESIRFPIKWDEFQTIFISSTLPDTLRPLTERIERLFETNFIAIVGEEEFNKILGGFTLISKEEFILRDL